MIELDSSTLIPDLHKAIPGPWLPTRIMAPDRRMPAAMLSILKPLGFTFRFYTPREEIMYGFAPGMVSIEVDKEKGVIVSKILRLSQKVGSLDAMRVTAHELGHALTISDTEVLANEAKDLKEHMTSDRYHTNEGIAESVAYLVLSNLVPQYEAKLRQETLNYIMSYRNAEQTLLAQGPVIEGAAAIILNHIGSKLGLEARYDKKIR